HIKDTMIAGCELSDPEIVRITITESTARVKELVEWGVDFDKNRTGKFDLAREGGHSEFRVLHHKDETGLEIEQKLYQKAKENANIEILENYFAVELITQHHLGVKVTKHSSDICCYGAYVYNPQSKTWDDVNINVMREDLVMTADWYYGQKESDRPKDATEYPLYEVKACGVMEETNDDSDYCVYMNIARVEAIKKETAKAEKTRVQQPSKDGKTYEQALVYVEDLKYVEEVNKKLKDDGYQTSSPIDWLQAMKETSAMIQKILGGIGGISLIVAALSITNTMVMSVYERTREIGVMKVIGANLKDIRRLFLVEAGMIGFVGGVVGVALSLLLSLLMNTVLFDILSSVLGSIGGGYGTTISVVPLWLVFAAIAFATAIGVLAGYSPANRAMKLSALESLKNE
ncbi:MAG: FAD-binding protein, partial [Firmicutes bacterium]|nr:FAD-binding protein [Bacillota bacterium]